MCRGAEGGHFFQAAGHLNRRVAHDVQCHPNEKVLCFAGMSADCFFSKSGQILSALHEVSREFSGKYKKMNIFSERRCEG